MSRARDAETILEGPRWISCFNCAGSGLFGSINVTVHGVDRHGDKASEEISIPEPCMQCDGTGKVIDYVYAAASRRLGLALPRLESHFHVTAHAKRVFAAQTLSGNLPKDKTLWFSFTITSLSGNQVHYR